MSGESERSSSGDRRRWRWFGWIRPSPSAPTKRRGTAAEDPQLAPNADLLGASPSDVEEFPGDARAAGVQLLERMTLSRQWIHRRAEEICLLERRTWRRTVTIYFTLPAEKKAGALRTEGGGCLVPLTYLAKRKLTLFHLTDETGAMVPAFTSAARERICVAGLQHLAETVLGEHPAGPLANDVETIVRADAAQARDAFERLRTVLMDASPADAEGLSAEQFEAGREVLLGVADELADNILLIAPLRGGSGRQRILRFSYEEAASRAGTTIGRRLLRWIGWRATTLRFPVPAIGDAARFNVEVIAPTGMQLGDPRLESNGLPIDAAEGSFGSVHLESPAARPPAAVVLALRLRAETVVRAAWMNAAFATAILVVGGIHLQQLETPGRATSLLLVVPSLMTLYLAQRSDSAVTTVMAFRMKALGTVPALCAYTAAGLLLLASGYEWTGKAWWALTATAALALAALTGAWWADRWRTSHIAN